MERISPELHPSLTPAVAESLHSRQILTVLDFVKADIQSIIRITRLTFQETLALRRFLLRKYSAPPLDGLDLYKATIRSGAIIPTGVESIDRILGGGLFTGEICEICGPPGSGKTQFALSLVKNAVCSLNQTVLFLDTKSNFVASRMKSMLQDKCSSEAELADRLKRIIVQRTNTRHALINALFQLKTDLEKSSTSTSASVLRLVILDSLPYLFLQLTEDHTDNNSFLSHVANVLRYLAVQHHVACLVTNITTSWNEGDFVNQQSSKEKVACGKYWKGVPNVRMKMEGVGAGDNGGSRCRISVMKSDRFNGSLGEGVEVCIEQRGLVE